LLGRIPRRREASIALGSTNAPAVRLYIKLVKLHLFFQEPFRALERCAMRR